MVTNLLKKKQLYCTRDVYYNETWFVTIKKGVLLKI